jgi:hypothetical protein
MKNLLFTLTLLMTVPATAQHPRWFSASVDGFASASGTWARRKLNPTLQYSTRIECWQKQKMCVEATVNESAPFLEYYDILTWDKDELIARDSVICGAVILRFDFHAETVSTTLVPNGELGYQGACEKYLPPPTMLTGSALNRMK